MRSIPTYRATAVMLVPVNCAVSAATLFLIQGGFGAGHGRFDQLIGVLGLPGILLSELFATQGASDLGAVVAASAAINILVWYVIAVVLSYWRKTA